LGFMGCGKSYIGSRLAVHLDYDFVDLDTYIEKKINKKIGDIFTDEGEDKFRKIENISLKEMVKYDNAVIASGGGTPCFTGNLEWMKENGTTFYLKADADLLFNRLSKQKLSRPLISNLEGIQLLDYIREEIIKREKYYLQSDHIINAGLSAVDEIIKRLG